MINDGFSSFDELRKEVTSVRILPNLRKMNKFGEGNKYVVPLGYSTSDETVRTV